MSRGSPSSVQAWIGLLPEHLRDRVEAPAVIFVLAGAVLWTRV
jgi:hypothetical protein